MTGFRSSIIVGFLFIFVGLFQVKSVHAQQPLSAFIEAASSRALDVRASKADFKQARARREVARGALLPALSANGRYGHNQYEIDFTPPSTTTSVIIQRQDQLTGDVTVSMPIIDLSAWANFFQYRSLAKASDWNVSLTRLDVFVQVVRQWYALVSARALVTAAQRSLDASVKARDDAKVRVRVGSSVPLELSRANAEVARAEQSLANAKLERELVARLLADLTFLEPSDDAVELEGVGNEPDPLESFVARAVKTPRAQVAKAQHKAAKSAARAAGFGLFPTVDGFFTESVTNSAGFSKSRQWVVGLAANWIFDYSRPAATRAERAGAERANIDEEKAVQQVRTAIFEAWHRVVTARAQVESAMAEEEASKRAANDARARFVAGSATQLDQIQADRDYFDAEVSRIAATANLGVARAGLYLQAGLPLPK